MVVPECVQYSGLVTGFSLILTEIDNKDCKSKVNINLCITTFCLKLLYLIIKMFPVNCQPIRCAGFRLTKGVAMGGVTFFLLKVPINGEGTCIMGWLSAHYENAF